MDKPEQFTKLPSLVKAIRYVGSNVESVKEFCGKDFDDNVTRHSGPRAYDRMRGGYYVLNIGEWVVESQHHGHYIVNDKTFRQRFIPYEGEL